jgi:hypothetical protein
MFPVDGAGGAASYTRMSDDVKSKATLKRTISTRPLRIPNDTYMIETLQLSVDVEHEE